jgi:hypothetical protein
MFSPGPPPPPPVPAPHVQVAMSQNRLQVHVQAPSAEHVPRLQVTEHFPASGSVAYALFTARGAAYIAAAAIKAAHASRSRRARSDVLVMDAIS